jgi:hypothetical protein
MGTFIGTKLVKAIPMTRQAYADYRGWTLPADEAHLAEEDGCLVEYLDGGRANDPRHDGYISWSPADVFIASYRSTKGMTFGMAIEAMRMGKKVARFGWNGKGMFLYLVGEGRYPPSTVPGLEIASRNKDGLVPYLPYIAMKTVNNDVVPWLASQTDMLGEDWEIV